MTVSFGGDARLYRWMWVAQRLAAAIPAYFVLSYFLLVIQHAVALTGFFAPTADLDLSPFDPFDVAFMLVGASAVIFIGRYRSAAVAFGSLATLIFATKVGFTVVSFRDLVKILSGEPGTAHLIRDAVQAGIVVLPGIVAVWCASRLFLRGPASAPAIASRFSAIAKARRQAYRRTSLSRIYWMVVGAAGAVALWLVANAALTIVATSVLGLSPAQLEAYLTTGDTSALDAPSMQMLFFLSVAVLALLAAAMWLLLRAVSRRMRRSASAVLADANYRPIVVLRSFKDESASVRPLSFLRSLFGWRYRLEEVVVARLAALGPSVAIGLPGERLPPLGALRDYYSDDQWQAAVLGWLNRAEAIVVIAGSSPWALWEMKHILHNGLAPRTILVVPQDTTAALRSYRWTCVMSTAADTEWSTSLATTEPTNLVAIVFVPGGSVRAVYGDPGDQVSYDLAVQFAVVEQDIAVRAQAVGS